MTSQRNGSSHPFAINSPGDPATDNKEGDFPFILSLIFLVQGLLNQKLPICVDKACVNVSFMMPHLRIQEEKELIGMGFGLVWFP